MDTATRPGWSTLRSWILAAGFHAAIALAQAHGPSAPHASPTGLESLPLPPLRSAAEALALSQLEHHSPPAVDLTGIVTLAPTPWGNSFFVQDATAGIFVHVDWSLPVPFLSPGDRVWVSGNVFPGEFAPQIHAASVQHLGPAPLPEPVAPRWRDLMSGRLDAQWLQIDGIVRSVAPPDPSGFANLWLMTQFGRLQVVFCGTPPRHPASWVDAEVRLHGVCVAVRNRVRQFEAPMLYVPGPDQVQVTRPAPPHPESIPLRHLGNLLEYETALDWGHRLRIRGTVTHGLAQGSLFLQDGADSLRVETTPDLRLRPGTLVEALGFPRAAPGGKPILQDAECRILGDGPPPQPQPFPSDPTTLDETWDATLVQLQGTVARHGHGADGIRLFIESQGTLLQVVLGPHLDPIPIQHLTPGALLDLMGIYLHRPLGDPSSTPQILLRQDTDLVVLRAGPWWTLERSLWFASSIACALVISVLALARLGRAHFALRQTKDALACAQAGLEQRVRERTAELELEVAQRRAAESEALNARHEAEGASRAKSQFLATMSHEIRTPLNAVIGMTNLLLDTPLDAEQRDFAETARLSGEALLSIINDVLDFSKIEAGKIELEQAPFDLSELVEGVASLTAERAQAKNIELALLIESDVPRRLVGDPGRLRQVLLNLVANAIKFTALGEVVVNVARLHESPDAVRLLFCVRDTGIGIDPVVLTRLFQPFVQADGSTTRQYGGTGLGLAISRRLVERMSGHLRVDSTPGKGSTFEFDVELLKNLAPAPPSPTRAPLAGRRVLIVDDNTSNGVILDYQITRWQMRNGGFATNGLDALRLLRDAVDAGDPYDLALLDMQMPGMDGLALARRIQADPRLASTRLIMLTSVCQRPSERELRAAGISAHLVKPVKEALLRETLASILALSHPPLGSPTTSESRSVRPLTPALLSPSPRLRVLLAEDNLINQKVTCRQLAKLGYTTDTVTNGHEVLQAMARHPYDVILMDCHMPEFDGYQATRRLRETGHGPESLVIIAMTANALIGDRDRCHNAGMDDYITKPARLADLQAALQRAEHRLHSRSDLAHPRSRA